MSAPAVSLLLPTDADVAVTLRCLRAVARLPEEPDFEVVVVVPAADAANRELVENLEGDVQVVVDEDPGASPGDALDRAAARAAAPALVALTASAIPADGWLADLLAALQDDATAAALPRSLTAEAVDLPEAAWLALAVRAEAFQAVGGFGATRAHGRAEKLSLLDALRAGGRTVATARAAVLLAG